jgi:hypothetical protein
MPTRPTSRFRDPIREDDQHIGVLLSLTETTDQVVGARRNAALREVAATSAGARSVDDAARRAAEAISRHPTDVPFALIYLVAADRASARLAATTLLPARNAVSPEVIDLDAKHEAGWSVALALQENRTVVVDDLLSRFRVTPRRRLAVCTHHRARYCADAAGSRSTGRGAHRGGQCATLTR